MENLEKTEREFDCFFGALGYARVCQDVGSSPRFDNADYVHKMSKTVVELKILDKEFFENGGIIDSLRALILRPVSIDEKGVDQYRFRLPDANREGKHDDFEEPLRRVIKKANKQIRATRSHYFGEGESYGFLIIAQLGLSSLSPEMTAAVVRKILYVEFSSIDGAIVCTPYYNLVNPFTSRRNPVCVSITNEISPFKKGQCMNIADIWMKFYENGGHPS